MVVVSFRNVKKDFKVLSHDIKTKYTSLTQAKIEGLQYVSKDGTTRKEAVTVMRGADNLVVIDAYPTLAGTGSAYHILKQS